MSMFERIQMLAKRKGVSVLQVERDLGFPRSSIRKFDTNRPSVDKLIAMADYFGVSTDYICENTDVAEPADKLFDSDVLALQRAKHNMKAEDWDRVMKMVRAGFASAFDDKR